MPGQDYASTCGWVAESVMPDGPDMAMTVGAARREGGGPDGMAPRPPGRLASRLDRPAVPGLITLLAALAFVLARLHDWAKGHISRFILVGRHFVTPAQLPHGIAVSPTYGYDGQFFYRLALDPLNMHPTAYGITMDHPYRYMRIGYPALTWLVSLGQHVLVPVMLVVVNVAAVGALGWLGGVIARHGRAARAGRAAAARLLRPITSLPVTPPSRSVPSACWPGCSRSGPAAPC